MYITNYIFILIYIFSSELKRRLKAEQKAKEKLEKDAIAKNKQPIVKKETDVSAATKSADISPNVLVENINVEFCFTNSKTNF